MSSPGLKTSLRDGAPACELARPLLPAGLFSAPRFCPNLPSPPRFREGIRSNPYKNQAPTHSRKSVEKRCPLFSTNYELPCFPVRSISFVFLKLPPPGGGGGSRPGYRPGASLTLRPNGRQVSPQRQGAEGGVKPPHRARRRRMAA